MSQARRPTEVSIRSRRFRPSPSCKLEREQKRGTLPLLPFLFLRPLANCRAVTRFETLAIRMWVDSCKLVAAELTFISGHFIPFA